MIRPALALALFLAVIPASTAQQIREDIRISPLEPFSFRLPDDIRIEAAATIGVSSLVVWGTREVLDGPAVVSALRMQIVRNGSPIGSPVPLHSPSARPSRLVRVVAHENAFNIYWFDVRSGDTGLYRQSVDHDGARLGDETKLLDGKIIDLTAYAALPGLTLALREKVSPVFILPDGSIDSSGINRMALTQPHILNADSSMISLEDDSILFRSSFRNGTITHSLRLPADALLPGMATIGRSSSGEIILTWLKPHPDPFVFCGRPSDAVIVYLVMQSRIVDRTRYDSPATIDTLGICGSSGCTATASLTSAARQPYMGGFMVTLNLSTSYKCPGQSGGGWSTTHSYHVGPNGRYMRMPGQPQPAYADEFQPVRVHSDTTSVVALLSGSDSIPVSSPIAPVSVGIPQIGPGLLARAGKVFAGWRSEKLTVTYRALHDTGAGISLSFAVGNVWSEPQRINHTVDAYPRALSNAMTIDGYVGRTSPGSSSTVHTIYNATENGWRQIFQRSGAPVNYRRATYARDPNTGLISGAVDLSVHHFLFYSLDDTGRITATFDHHDTLWGASTILPLDSTSFLLINGDTLHSATAAAINSITVLPPVDSGATVRYERLYGESFLRVALSPDSLRLRVDRFLLDGALLESREIDLRYRSTEPAFALDPRDSSIFIVLGSTRGVRMIHLRSDLSILHAERQASVTNGETHNPAAIVLNDSLHIVWEDYRVGNSDIFAQSHGAPFEDLSNVEMMMERDRPVARNIAIAGLAPNPADDAASLRFLLARESMVTLEIADMTGRMLERHEQRFEAGENRWDLDIADLRAGSYIILLSTENSTDGTRLIVLPTR